jgi:Pyrimidine dimer DNA glycosylase
MITFVPFADVTLCAKYLDYRRLGKQRVEAYQIWRALNGLSKGWVNHPATQMWKGHTCFLAMYCNAMIDEWIAQGYRNFMAKLPHCSNPRPPPWWGWPPVHLSHQAALNRKKPDYYHFEETEYMKWGYAWPTKTQIQFKIRNPEPEQVCEPLKHTPQKTSYRRDKS